MGRLFDRELKCGCLISSEDGGGLIPCYAEYGDMSKKKDRDDLKLHDKSWKAWTKTKDYKKHIEEIRERNE